MLTLLFAGTILSKKITREEEIEYLEQKINDLEAEWVRLRQEYDDVSNRDTTSGDEADGDIQTESQLEEELISRQADLDSLSDHINHLRQRLQALL